MHHDQAIGDFRQNGKLQVVTWNQISKSLIIADVPHNPKTDKWTLETIFLGETDKKGSIQVRLNTFNNTLRCYKN